MTDNTNGNPQGGETAQPQGGTTPAQGAGDNVDLLGKISRLEADNKKYRDERKALDEAQRKAQEEQLMTQQKWEELAKGYKGEVEKLSPIAQQYEAISEAFNDLLENELKDIPDDVRRKLVEPARAKMSPVEFASWLRGSRDFLQVKKAPNLDNGAGNSTTGARLTGITPTPDDVAMAAALGIPIYRWMQRKAEAAASKANPPKD